MKNKTSSKNEIVEMQSMFDVFTSFIVYWATVIVRIFNIYLVCCWCQTIFAAIMAAIVTVICCSLIHSKIYNVLTKGEFSKITKQLMTNVMLNCDTGEYLDKLNALAKDHRWAILLFQGILTCVLKFVIG